MELNDH